MWYSVKGLISRGKRTWCCRRWALVDHARVLPLLLDACTNTNANAQLFISLLFIHSSENVHLLINAIAMLVCVKPMLLK